MRTRLHAGILLVTLTAFAGDKVQRLNIKAGLWENTTTTTTKGQLPIPAEMLERLTPDQRARMEARMKAQPSDRSRTLTTKECVTEKDLEKDNLFSTSPSQECTKQIVDSTATSAEIHVTCNVEGIQGGGTVKIQVLSPESVKGSAVTHATGNGQTMNTNSTFTAKWLSASCGNVK